jgi:nitrite reductase/ring-hydroxylating ferredoxin subunit
MSALAAVPRNVFVGSLAQIEGGEVLTVRLTHDEFGRPREAIVLVDANQIPRAYLNLCRHLPVPLDAASREFLIDGQLQCVTHGARYRVEDGLCVAGPCRGTSLYALELRVEGADLFVVEPPVGTEIRFGIRLDEGGDR